MRSRVMPVFTRRTHAPPLSAARRVRASATPSRRPDAAPPRCRIIDTDIAVVHRPIPSAHATGDSAVQGIAGLQPSVSS